VGAFAAHKGEVNEAETRPLPRPSRASLVSRRC